MPINSQSLGKDISFNVVTATGTLTLDGITDYDIKQSTTELRHKGLNGKTDFAYIPDGWTISIKLERRNQTIDRYFAQLEASYYAGVNLLPGTILETIQEVDGTTSQYQYTNVVLKYDDAGNWKSDSFVSISLTGMATQRVRIA